MDREILIFTFSLYTKKLIIDNFCFGAFWSGHCNPKLISNCQHGSMDPDILTVTSPIV